jgi:hypothetical protein
LSGDTGLGPPPPPPPAAPTRDAEELWRAFTRRSPVLAVYHPARPRPERRPERPCGVVQTSGGGDPAARTPGGRAGRPSPPAGGGFPAERSTAADPGRHRPAVRLPHHPGEPREFHPHHGAAPAPRRPVDRRAPRRGAPRARRTGRPAGSHAPPSRSCTRPRPCSTDSAPMRRQCWGQARLGLPERACGQAVRLAQRTTSPANSGSTLAPA